MNLTKVNDMAAIEIDLVRDLLIGLMCLDFAMGVFAAAIVGQSLPLANPGLQQLNHTMANINQAGTNLGNSFCTSYGSL